MREHLDAIRACTENPHMDDRERLLMVIAAVEDARAALAVERRTQIVKVYHVDEDGVSKCEAMYGPYTVEEAIDWETKINRQMKHDHVHGFVVVDQLSEDPW